MGTLKTYYTRANNLKQFLHHINRTDILCEEIDTAFAKEYLKFLKNVLGHNQYYAKKNVEVLKIVLNKAVELKILHGSPLVTFTVKKGKPKPIIALDEEELQKDVVTPSYELRFTCTSSNPYLIEVNGNSDVISGNSFINYTLKKGTYAWQVTQQSGYALYPTVNEGTVNLDADKEIVFP